MAVVSDFKEVDERRSLYDTPEKRRMLMDELVELGLFSSIPMVRDGSRVDEQAVARHNYAVAKLYGLGLIQDDKMYDLIDRMWSIDYKG